MNEMYAFGRSLPELRECLSSIEPSTLPDAMAFPSLSFAYVRTADVLRVAGRQAMHRLTRAIMGEIK